MTKLVISFLIHLGKALAAIQFKDQILSYEKNYDSRFNTGGTGRGIFDFVRFRARTSNDHHYNDSRNGDPTFRHHNHASDNHGLLSAVFPGKGHVIGVPFSFAQRGRGREAHRAYDFSGVASAVCASSSAWLTTGAMACNFSIPRKSINLTPMVFRPTTRISFTRVRTN